MSVNTLRRAARPQGRDEYTDARIALPLVLAEDVRTSSKMIAEHFDTDRDSFFIDDREDPATICWVNVNDVEQHVRVVYLLPFAAPAGRLVPVFREAMLDAASKHPGALRYEVQAFFDTERQCLAWKLYFDDASVDLMGNGKWKIALPSFAEAVREIETWRL